MLLWFCLKRLNNHVYPEDKSRKDEADMELKELLDKCINDRLIDLTISGQKVKNEEAAMRVKIRPVQLKDEIKYQASEFVGKRCFMLIIQRKRLRREL